MPTSDQRTPHRGGIRIRWYLTALVLVPLLGLSGFAVYEAGKQLDRAGTARRVELVIHRAERVATARAHLQQEIMPAIAQSFLRNPGALTSQSLSGVDVGKLGLTATALDELRAGTDRALRQLAADPALAGDARRVQRRLAAARHEIDRTATLSTGFAHVSDVLVALDDVESKLIRTAHSLGVDHATAQRLDDVQLVAELAHSSELTMEELSSATLAEGATRTTAYATLVESWGRDLAAVTAVQRDASPDLAKAVARAMSTKNSLIDPDRAVADYVVHRTPLPLMQLGLIYSVNQTRSVALYQVLRTAIADVHLEASEERAAADHRAMIILVLLAALLLTCLVVGAAVRRAIAKPMQELAEEAQAVSQGELVPVKVHGPSEVRTMARGLAAAVDNLRRIETQALALASGDLESETVRQPLPGALGAVMHRSVSAVIDAIHQRDAAQNDLAHRATHDALTELPNRTQAMEVIRRALHRAQRSGSLTGLMFIDLDHFKRVNDTLGHNAGDVVLQTCASRMAASLRAGDTVFRLGGDEFVMLMEDVAGEVDAVHLAERLIDAVSAPVPIDEGFATVGASIGLAFSGDGGVDAERLLNDADAAAYRAKQSGRGRVGIFDDELRAILAERAELEAALTHALRAGELVLHYQPIVALDTGTTIGVEALMRWQRPGHGLVPPNDFIPAAEASSLINDLGRWALHEATAQLARWDAEGRTDPEFTIAVNVSGRHLVSNHLLDDVRDALDASGIDPSRVTLELTETVLVDDPLATRNLTTLREMGVRIAIDDFGTGYTSIGQLPRLPIDKLKIDRSFVSSTDPTHRELIPLIVAAAHAFGLTVVAEGIEKPEQADSLDGLGVDSGQGFYFARPQPAGTPGLLGERLLDNTA